MNKKLGTAILLTGITTVSYTHLDVYKRQKGESELTSQDTGYLIIRRGLLYPFN